MKFIIFAFAFCLAFGQVLWAQELPVEGDKTLLMYDPPTDTLSIEQLDSNGVIAKPPPAGGGHGGGHGGGSGGGHGGGHGGGGTVHGGHGNHPPGHWSPYPGWHNGWHHDPNWHPGWWHAGIHYPPWVWGEVPYGYWQCTAFNGNMQAFTSFGPDEEQAEYGALYACGGSNFQQFGCYVPEGYCQPN